MKVCENCGIEHGGRDGDNLCAACDELEAREARRKLAKRRATRRAREEVLKSLGMTKVRGALGGTYWE